jgi:hypothetical protein
MYPIATCNALTVQRLRAESLREGNAALVPNDAGSMPTAQSTPLPLGELLREEVEARPVVAYRLLELLARTGWAVRIDRGERIHLHAERQSLTLACDGASVGEAAVALFVEAAEVAARENAPRRRGPNRRRAA